MSDIQKVPFCRGILGCVSKLALDFGLPRQFSPTRTPTSPPPIAELSCGQESRSCKKITLSHDDQKGDRIQTQNHENQCSKVAKILG